MTDQEIDIRNMDTRDLEILQDFEAGIDAALLVEKYGVTVDYIIALILEAYKDD
jgi:hypothetical protein